MFTYWKSALALAVLVIWTSNFTFAADKLSPEDVLARHLESIGKREVRGEVKTRLVEGRATYRVLVGGSGAIDGKSVFVSEAQNARMLLKIAAVIEASNLSAMSSAVLWQAPMMTKADLNSEIFCSVRMRPFAKDC
jgi:hypothetical protein